MALAAPGFKQRVQALDGINRGRKAQSFPVRDFFRGAGDKGGDDCGPLVKGRGHQRPDLLRLPGRKRYHGALREISLQQLQGLRVGVGGAVLPGLKPGVGVDHYKSVEGLSIQVAAALLADGVHAGGYMLEGRYEGRVRRGHPDVGAEAGQARHQGPHAVLADAPGRDKARAGVGGGVKKAFAEAAGRQVYAGRVVKIGRSYHNGPAG